MRVITFISDFGHKDWFVSAVKGEILKINPEAKIIDITHSLNQFDVKQAAFILKNVYKNFPIGTIHLAVVDPGVGSKRKPLIAYSDGYYFVGPDNGIFSYIYRKPVVYEIKVQENISNTFHARDVFAPVAARLSLGVEPEKLGKRIYQYINFPFPMIKRRGKKIYGEIIYVDRFGNLITNIPNEITLSKIYIDGIIVVIKKFYAQGISGEIIGIRGSSGFYEIACFKEPADKKLNIGVGHKIIGELKK